MTISPEHAARLAALHARDPNFGVIGHLWADRVVSYMRAFDALTILDYGAGRSGLAAAVTYRFLTDHGIALLAHEYEPAFGHLPPEPAEFVTCIDVLEHVERLMLESVLLDLRRCMLKGGLVTISLRNRSPKKKLTHPIVRDRDWWWDRIRLYFSATFDIQEVEILDPTKASSEVAFLLKRKT